MIKNVPYKKDYDNDGVLLNPIKLKYPQPNPNRATRRKAMRGFLKSKGL